MKSTVDMAGIRNRFQFANAMNACPDPTVRSEWDRHQTDAFSLEVLEELAMKPDQTAGEFAEDVEQLYKLWQAKLAMGEGKQAATGNARSEA